MRVTVPGPAVLEHKDADEVDEESEDGDHQQPLVLDLRRLDQPLHSLGEYEEGDEEEEEAVDEPGQCLCPHISEAVLVVRLPLGNDCGHQTRQQAWSSQKCQGWN